MTKIIGLTGSIGMGKSATADMFRENNIPVFDSDATVHELMGQGGAACPLVEEAFPGVLGDGGIDRQKLGKIVFGQPELLKKLENILHPMVSDMRGKFLKEAEEKGEKIVLFDIPLLFETGSDKICDYIVVVSAPFEVQKERVLARPGMTEEKFEAILKKQTPDEVKRDRADFIVASHLGFDHAREQVKEIITKVISSC